jgi:hypothetical protein
MSTRSDLPRFLTVGVPEPLREEDEAGAQLNIIVRDPLVEFAWKETVSSAGRRT